MLQLLEELNAESGRTIVMVVHDLNHAARYAHHMIAIKKGQAIAVGAPEEVVTSEVLREVFGIEADIVTDPRSGVPLCLPYELYRAATEGRVRAGKKGILDGKVASIL
ncbi:putative siderophore transport system ATP-binding protein YusV [compost metagenome]